MKKTLLITLCLFSLNAHAADFTTTLGAECSRILYNLSNTTYPEHHDIKEIRNKQFEALGKCLELYYRVGGQMDDLNKRYAIVSNSQFVDCKDTNNIIECLKLNDNIREVSFAKTFEKIQQNLEKPIKYSPQTKE